MTNFVSLWFYLLSAIIVNHWPLICTFLFFFFWFILLIKIFCHCHNFLQFLPILKLRFSSCSLLFFPSHFLLHSSILFLITLVAFSLLVSKSLLLWLFQCYHPIFGLYFIGQILFLKVLKSSTWQNNI